MKTDGSIRKVVKRVSFIVIAAALMATNINTFVHTGGLYPGGATGLTVLIQRVGEIYLHVKLPYTVINLVLNALPIYVGFRFIGKKFTAYSCLMILLTNLFTDIMPGFTITYDILLISIFGGMINGFAISLCLMVEATSGGTDFISEYLSMRRGIDAWNTSLVINVFILAAAGLIFGWDKALYSIIFQFLSTQVIHIFYKKYRKETLLVVTNQAEPVCKAIFAITNHGATVIPASGAYAHAQRDVVYSVISSTDTAKTVNRVRQVDPMAFVNVIKTEQVYGTFYHRPTE
ncbi:MAG: YitT family protein [Oscillospiraceae bacterium]|nr:YitT family protein [Oscillospiraceae bacterium]